MSNPEQDVNYLLGLSLADILSTDVLILEGDKNASDATSVMKEKNARSVLVTHLGEAIGIVTKTDVLFKVMAQGKNPSKVRLREIMSSPVITLSPKSTVSEALAIMDKHVVRQVYVTSAQDVMSTVVGMVTREGLFEKIHKATLSATASAISGTPVCIINPKAIAFIKDLAQGKLACPYCGSPFDDKEALSKHIDRIHGGSGVLEGDFRQMMG